MAAYREDGILTETLERIRRAELATVLHPPGSPEHARAVARLDRVTRQMLRLQHALLPEGGPVDEALVSRRGSHPVSERPGTTRI